MDCGQPSSPARTPILLLALALSGCASYQPTQPVAKAAPAARIPPAAPLPPKPVEQVIDLGHSIEGEPIRLHVLGDPSDRWPTLVMGAIHGNEPTSATVARNLLERLRADPTLLGHRKVAILPVANPDGLARRLRTNKNLIDLNRSFPASNWKKTRRGAMFGGEQPATEPETLALLKAFELLRPARVISIHSMNAPCNNYDGPAAALAQLMSQSNGYPVKDSIGYPTPGSLGSWAGADRRIPTITLELPRSQDGESAWRQNRDALLAVIRSGESIDSIRTASWAP